MTRLQIDRPQRKVSNWVSGALVVALLIGAVLMGFLETLGNIATGVQAPAFSFERFTGGQLSSAELKGKVVMLDFWATTCPPCVEEMPMLVKIAQEYQSQGVVFAAVSLDEPEDAKNDVAAFIRDQVPGLEPFAGFGNEAGSAFSVRAIPTLYILDRQGKIIGSQTGQVSERKVRSWLDAALAGAR